MCGLAGLISSRPERVDLATFQRSIGLISHRGPDGGGLYRSPDHKVMLGHRRLTIIDLSDASSQPFETDKIAISYNGEIYNYRELRRELSAEGVKFRSSGDTEVIATGFEKWGSGIFSRLQGMFAVAIYDKREENMTLARDIFGIKPLYLRTDMPGVCIFGSELKSLSIVGDATVNSDTLMDFCGWGYSLSNQSLFRGTRHVEPGEIVTLSFHNGQLKQQSATFSSQDAPVAAETGPEHIRQVLRSSIRDHMVADVPVALALSGGLDSSVIAALASQEQPHLTAFTFTSSDATDSEVEHAKLMCQTIGLDHKIIRVGIEDLDAVLWRIAYHLEEPIPNLNCLPTFALSSFVNSEGYKVILVGEGSDELFAGYPWHMLINDRELVHTPLEMFARLRSRCGLNNHEAYLRPETRQSFEARAQRWASDFEATVFGEGVASLNSFLSYEQRFQLQFSQLQRIDRMTMAHGVEARVPYLYGSVLSSANQLPDRMRIRKRWFQFFGRNEKIALAKSVSDLLPKRISNRPKFGAKGTVNLWKTPIAAGIDKVFDHVMVSDKYRQGRQSVEEWIDWSRASEAKVTKKEKLFLTLLAMTMSHSVSGYRDMDQPKLQGFRMTRPAARHAEQRFERAL